MRIGVELLCVSHACASPCGTGAEMTRAAGWRKARIDPNGGITA